MNYKLLTCFILLAFTASANSKPATDNSSAYDEKLAKELGADNYGMRSYVFVTLLTGPKDAAITNKEKRAAIFAGHFSNMSKLKIGSCRTIH